LVAHDTWHFDILITEANDCHNGTTAIGFDVVSLSPDGRIRSVAGFIDQMPG